jgi:chorismate synthase
VAKQLLSQLGVEIVSHVTEIGGIKTDPESYIGKSAAEIREIVESDAVYCADPSVTKQMTGLIDETKKNGDSIGGTVEVIIEGMPPGIGSYVHYDRKLDAKIAASVMSINAFKGVEFGLGFEMARKPGSQVHDEILWSEELGYTRKTNNLGGFEGGMTTGMPIIVRGVMKPIPTLYKPLQSVDIETKEPFQASIERSDSCAVPAASIVAEHVVAWEAANALLEQFDGDQLPRLKENVQNYLSYTKGF